MYNHCMTKQLKNIRTTTEACIKCQNYYRPSVAIGSQGVTFKCTELRDEKKRIIPDKNALRFIHEDCPLKDAREPGVMVGVSVFLLNEKNQLLVGERDNASSGTGCWGLPGGGMEAGQTPKETGRREMEEETSIIIEEEDMEFATFTNDVFIEESGEHWITLYFICRKFKGEAERVEPHKCKQWKWVDLDNIPEPVFCDWAKNIDKLKAMLL